MSRIQQKIFVFAVGALFSQLSLAFLDSGDRDSERRGPDITITNNTPWDIWADSNHDDFVQIRAAKGSEPRSRTVPNANVVLIEMDDAHYRCSFHPIPERGPYGAPDMSRIAPQQALAITAAAPGGKVEITGTAGFAGCEADRVLNQPWRQDRLRDRLIFVRSNETKLN